MIILLEKACQIAAIMLCLCVTPIIVIVITIVKVDQPTVLKRIAAAVVLEFKLGVKKFILIVRSSIVH